MFKQIILGIILIIAVQNNAFAQSHSIDSSALLLEEDALIRKEMSCVNKEDGEYKYPGKVYVITNCKNGKKDGIQILRPQQGTSWGSGYEENYKNGDLEGIKKYFSLNGKVSRTENYSKGKLNGLVTSYSLDGKIEKEIEYKDDQKNDFEKRILFFPDGPTSVNDPI